MAFLARLGYRAGLRSQSATASCWFQQCNFAAEAQQAEQQDDEAEITVTVNSYRGHNLDELPSTEVQSSKAELLRMFSDMYTMRRMELAADLLCKARPQEFNGAFACTTLGQYAGGTY